MSIPRSSPTPSRWRTFDRRTRARSSSAVGPPVCTSHMLPRSTAESSIWTFRYSGSATDSRPWLRALGVPSLAPRGSEYGGTTLTVCAPGTLLNGLPETQNVWMSHGDSVDVPPPGFEVLASTPGAPVAAFENVERRMAGVQFHPEVMHTAHGQRILEHFLWQIAECEPTWTMSGIIDEQVARIRDQVGDSRSHLRPVGGS